MRTFGISLLLLAVVATTPAAHADPEPARHRLSFEQDPVAYFLDGWDVLVAYQHPALPRARITVGVYAVDWPSAPDGFRDRQTAAQVKLAYHRGAGGRGWMAGVQLVLAREEFTSETMPGRDTIDTLIAGPIAGYRWFPFRRGFFVYPWVRLAVRVPLRGDRDLEIGEQRATASWLVPVMTFHVGYEIAF